MTNNEILQADLLDILFEYRNKSYGAYTLRRYYNKRLLKSLGIALSAVLLFFLISTVKSGQRSKGAVPENKDVVKLSSIEIAQPKQQDPLPPAKKQPIVSQVKDVTIKIVPDKLDDPIPDQQDISKNAISEKTIEGTAPEDLTKAVNSTVDSSSGKQKETQPETKFEPIEKQPSFPGGPEALALFFSRTLSSPTDLEPGEKKIILIRFVVGADGSITKAEIIQSGGDEYDSEVLRAFKRMPKWNRAIQNGIRVATSFTQPVTFVGVE